MLTDIQIAQQTPCLPIVEIAKKLNIDADDLEMYGKYKAKLPLSLNKKYADRENGKLILVTAINQHQQVRVKQLSQLVLVRQ